MEICNGNCCDCGTIGHGKDGPDGLFELDEPHSEFKCELCPVSKEE